MALVVGNPVKLSASLGGEPISLDDDTVPGKVVHLNDGADIPQHSDMLHKLLVTNPNSATVSLYLMITGPGIAPPSSREDMRRYDIVSTEEGRSTSLLPVPVILSPGFQVNVSVVLPPGGEPLLLDGVAFETENTDSGGTTGYGGLSGTDSATPSPIPDGPDWATVPFDSIATQQYKLVTPDLATDSIAVQQAGIWQMALSVTFTHPEDINGRTFLLRVYNLTDGSQIGSGIPIGIGRNQPATSFSSVFQIQVGETGVGKQIIIQAQSEGVDIPVTLWDSTEWSLVLIDTLLPVIDTGQLITHEPDDLVTHEPDDLIYLG